ncbi:TPA: hypothetical protein NHR53_002239 [Pseudomonas aeruginosa]|uniref:hypothetical protein n=1 Tax=Pseudomonas aeruginosa TaxID=287 RepID=UPI0011119A33|nr:hypothetical protein [Pseudomonas aeruginosa]HCE7245690.1 hypothetical protein [Pseudomonas aeruginosa]HCE8125700.1 hypothetical protein [Pseudomonas aeruginosa]HCF0444973.1 hypothetical protein [Pseudomonas aeruginosa]
MDTKRIIQAEAARAEALIGKYLGFYAGDLVLAELNIMAIDDVSDDFKRCVQMIQDLLDASPSKQVARNMVNLVDALTDLVRVPRLRQPLMRMWEIEETISSGGFWFIRHAVVIFLAFLGVCFVDDDMNTRQLVISYAAGLVGFISLALNLTHFKDPVRAFFIGIPVVLAGCVLVTAAGNETLMMFGLMLLSIGLFLKSVVGMFRDRNTGNGTPYEDELGLHNSSEGLFDDDADPFLHNHAGFVPYAADD